MVTLLFQKIIALLIVASIVTCNVNATAIQDGDATAYTAEEESVEDATGETEDNSEHQENEDEATAVSEDEPSSPPKLEITAIDYPSAVKPGDIFVLKVTVSNTSAAQANEVTLSLTTPNELSLANSASISLGSIEAENSKDYNYTLSVLSSISTMDCNIRIVVNYSDSDGVSSYEEQEERTVRIQSDLSSNLVISSLDVPSAAFGGSDFNVSVSIRNSGNLPLSNIEMSLAPDSDTVSSVVSSTHISVLEAGEAYRGNFSFHVPESAQTQNCSLDLSVRYQDSQSGKVYSVSDRASLLIQSVSESDSLSASLVVTNGNDATSLKAGQSGIIEVPIRCVSSSEGSVKNITATVTNVASVPLTFRDASPSSYISSMRVGSSSKFRFSVEVPENAQPGSYTLALAVTYDSSLTTHGVNYVDLFNQQSTLTVNFEITNTHFEENSIGSVSFTISASEISVQAGLSSLLRIPVRCASSYVGDISNFVATITNANALPFSITGGSTYAIADRIRIGEEFELAYSVEIPENIKPGDYTVEISFSYDSSLSRYGYTFNDSYDNKSSITVTVIAENPHYEEDSIGSVFFTLSSDEIRIAPSSEDTFLSIPISCVSAYVGQASNIAVSIKNAASLPFSFPNGSLYVVSDEVEIGTGFTVSFPIVIPDNIKPGNYDVEISISYDSSLSRFGHSFIKSFDNEYALNAGIVVENDHYEDDNIGIAYFVVTDAKFVLSAGESSVLSIPVRCVSSYIGEITNVISRINNISAMPFTLSNSSAYAGVDSLSVGDEAEISYPVKVPKTAKPGTYTLEIDLSFDSSLSEHGYNFIEKHDNSSVLYVNVEIINPEYDALQTAQPISIVGGGSDQYVYAGNSFTMFFDVANNTSVQLNNIYFTVELPSDLFFSGENSEQTFSLRGGEKKRITLPLVCSTNCSTTSTAVNATLDYKTSYGESYSVSYKQYVNLIAKSGDIPVLIIDNYHLDKEEIYGGDYFTLFVSLQNTSLQDSVKDVTITVNTSTASGEVPFSLVDVTNTFYIDSLAADSTSDLTIPLVAERGVEPGLYGLSFSLSYKSDNQEATNRNSIYITIPLKQEILLKVLSMSGIPEVEVNNETYTSISFGNLGKSRLYNVNLSVQGDGFTSDVQEYYVGNLDAGSQASKTLYFTPSQIGECAGNLLFTYEDADGASYSLKHPFTFLSKKSSDDVDVEQIIEAINEAGGINEDNSQSNALLIFLIALVLVVSTAIGANAYLNHLRRKKAAAEEEDELLFDESDDGGDSANEN